MISGVIPNTSVMGAPPADPNEWAPSHPLVVSLDKLAIQYTIPREFGPLTDYGRYYFGTEIRRRKVIVGVMIAPAIMKSAKPGDSAGFHVVPENEAPALAHGGCMVITTVFDISDKKITEQDCNSEQLSPPPQRSPVR